MTRFLLSLCFCSVGGSAFAANAPSSTLTSAAPAAAVAAAQNGIKTWGELQNLPLNELSLVGAPVREGFVGLDRLVAWNGEDASSLITTMDRFKFGLAINGQITAEESVALKSDGTWSADSFEESLEWAQALDRVTKIVAAQHPQVAPLEVSIPALSIDFIAVETPAGLVAYPMANDSRRQLSFGVPLMAHDLFLKLQAEGQTINPQGPVGGGGVSVGN